MEKYLCKCNNCDTVLIDRNPQDDAKQFSLEGKEQEMVLLGSPYGAILTAQEAIQEAYEYKIEPDLFWACPNCLTDEYLTDLL